MDNRQLHDTARRNAYNALEQVNERLNRGDIRRADEMRVLHDIADRATTTLRNLDELDRADRADYRSTNIGYRTSDDNRRRMLDDTLDALDRVLPHLDDRYNDVDDRRGVPGTGRYGDRRHLGRGGRRARADMDDWTDDWDDVDDRRARSRRTGRFVRAEMDDRMDDWDDATARRTGRYTRSDVWPPHTPVMPRTDDDRRRMDDDRTRNEDIGPGTARR